MPIEFKKEGNACERCKKLDTEVGPITYYTDPHDGYKGLLCSECIKRREKPYTEICPKCKRVAYEHGGMSAYGHEPPFEDMCLECVEKKEARDAKIIAIKSTIKNFAKNHWKFSIGTPIAIAALIVGLIGLVGNITEDRPDITMDGLQREDNLIYLRIANTGNIPNLTGTITNVFKIKEITKEVLYDWHPSSNVTFIVSSGKERIPDLTIPDEYYDLIKNKESFHFGILIQYTYGDDKLGEYGHIMIYDTEIDDFTTITEWTK